LAPYWDNYFQKERIAIEYGIGFKETLTWDSGLNDFVETTGEVHTTTYIGSRGTCHGTHVTPPCFRDRCSYVGEESNIQIKTVLDYFEMTPSTATRRIDSLVKAGIIIRDEEKWSSKILRLTPQEEEVYEMFENHQRDFTKRLADEFTDQEIITIHRLLNWITETKHLIFKF
jgi:DNA-binding MarR family transcriptional regulator